MTCSPAECRGFRKSEQYRWNSSADHSVGCNGRLTLSVFLLISSTGRRSISTKWSWAVGKWDKRALWVSAYCISQCPYAISDTLGNPLRRKMDEDGWIFLHFLVRRERSKERSFWRPEFYSPLLFLFCFVRNLIPLPLCSSLSLYSVLLWTTYLSFSRSRFVSLLRQIWTPYIMLHVLLCSAKLHSCVFSADKSCTMSLFIEDLQHIWNMSYVQPTAWMMNVPSSRARGHKLKLKSRKGFKGLIKVYLVRERETKREDDWVKVGLHYFK